MMSEPYVLQHRRFGQKKKPRRSSSMAPVPEHAPLDPKPKVPVKRKNASCPPVFTGLPTVSIDHLRQTAIYPQLVAQDEESRMISAAFIAAQEDGLRLRLLENSEPIMPLMAPKTTTDKSPNLEDLINLADQALSKKLFDGEAKLEDAVSDLHDHVPTRKIPRRGSWRKTKFLVFAVLFGGGILFFHRDHHRPQQKNDVVPLGEEDKAVVLAPFPVCVAETPPVLEVVSKLEKKMEPQQKPLAPLDPLLHRRRKHSFFPRRDRSDDALDLAAALDENYRPIIPTIVG